MIFGENILKISLGRNYLAPNESLIICLLKAAVAEPTDTPVKQHLLAALQKLSLRYRTMKSQLCSIFFS